MSEITLNELHDLLSRIRGPSITPNDAKLAASEMRRLGSGTLFPLLKNLLADSNAETRCLATLGVFLTDAGAAAELLIPMLNDHDHVVRWHTCGLMHDLADSRCIDQLIVVMQSDPDPQVRNTAAYALGGIGHPRAIPALIKTLESDHEYDEMGYNASSAAATALDDIIGSHHTRIRSDDGMCTLPSSPANRDQLKAEALRVYELSHE